MEGNNRLLAYYRFILVQSHLFSDEAAKYECSHNVGKCQPQFMCIAVFTSRTFGWRFCKKLC